MNSSFREGESPGKTYRIKLYEKEITVQVTYSSPPKNNKQNKNTNGSMDMVSSKQNKYSVMASGTKLTSSKQKKKQVVLVNRSKQFYANRFEESKNILEKYQQFHNNLAEGKVQARLKVYSNSKLQILRQDKSHCGLVPIRTVNITNPKREVSPKPMMKIRLYSNQNNKNKLQSSIKKQDLSKFSQQKQKSQEKKNEGQKSLLTPNRNRKYKLQVTTSKSRGKNDSIVSNREQLSKEILHFQLKNYGESMVDLRNGTLLNSLNIV